MNTKKNLKALSIILLEKSVPKSRKRMFRENAVKDKSQQNFSRSESTSAPRTVALLGVLKVALLGAIRSTTKCAVEQGWNGWNWPYYYYNNSIILYFHIVRYICCTVAETFLTQEHIGRNSPAQLESEQEIDLETNQTRHTDSSDDSLPTPMYDSDADSEYLPSPNCNFNKKLLLLSPH